MAVHQLLLRGMLVGILAGLCAFAFARLFGEPSVNRAIAFEAAHHQAEESASREHGATMPPDEEIFSRSTQSSFGLFTGVTVYGAALGGLFALVFAASYGRIGRLSPRSCAALLALLGFTVIYAVPDLKYPANPPSIGEPATIGMRTGLYFSMVGISLVALMVAFSLGRLAVPKLGGWNAALASGLIFIVLIAVAATALPALDEVPAEFPATVLWQFRLASMGLQATLWAVIGLLFGSLTERSFGTNRSH